MAEPTYFINGRAFRDWLEAHAGSATALLAGFRQVGSGRANMSRPESVDEALCYACAAGLRLG